MVLEGKAARFETLRPDLLVQQGLGAEAFVCELLCGLDALVAQLDLVGAAVVEGPQDEADGVRGGGLAHDIVDAVAVGQFVRVEGVDAVGVELRSLGIVFRGVCLLGGVCLLMGVWLIGVGAPPLPTLPPLLEFRRFRNSVRDGPGHIVRLPGLLLHCRSKQGTRALHLDACIHLCMYAMSPAVSRVAYRRQCRIG